jgi:hypothetical protein
MEKPLFSITDFEVKFYKASKGPGGQKTNKTSSAYRITHRPSGAVGDSKTHRSQIQNKKEAFLRLNASYKFKLWLNMQAGAILEGFAGIEQKVDKMMDEKNLKIEYSKTCIYCDKKAWTTVCQEPVCKEHSDEYNRIGRQWDGNGEPPSETLRKRGIK